MSEFRKVNVCLFRFCQVKTYCKRQLQMLVWTLISNCNITTTFKQEIAGVCQQLKPFRSNFGSGKKLYSVVKTSLFNSFWDNFTFPFCRALSSAVEMFRVRSQADASSAKGVRHERRVGHYIDLTETRNRAWKVASTLGTSRARLLDGGWARY